MKLLKPMTRRLAPMVGAVTALLACASVSSADFIWISSFSNDRVYKVDAATGATLMTISASVLDSPSGLALSPDRSTLYVSATNSSAADVYMFNTSTGANTGSLSSSFSSVRGLALEGNGTFLYVSSLDSDRLFVFNTSTGSNNPSVQNLNNPQGLTLAPDEGSIFIANSGGNNVIQASLPANAIIRTFTAPAQFYSPSDVILSPDGSTLYVSTFGNSTETNNQILRYNVSSGAYLGEWAVPAPAGDMYGMTLNSDGSTLYVADVFNSRILRIDTATGVASAFTTDAVLSNPAFLLYDPVPEPSAALLALCGVAALALRRNRRMADNA